jgi:hypothetical protein
MSVVQILVIPFRKATSTGSAYITLDSGAITEIAESILENFG